MRTSWLWESSAPPGSEPEPGIIAYDLLDEPEVCWGVAFRELARSPEAWSSPLPLPKAGVDFPLRDSILDPRAGDAALRRYVEAWRKCRLEVKG